MFKTLDMMKKGDQKGFTLIELLIVIAIIAILAAIAIPQYAQYRQKAAASSANGQLQVCVSQLSAQYSDAGLTTMVCPVGTTNQTITIDSSTGSVNNIPGTFTVKGMTVICTYTNNVISCN